MWDRHANVLVQSPGWVCVVVMLERDAKVVGRSLVHHAFFDNEGQKSI
jgi:hypothetical protein